MANLPASMSPAPTVTRRPTASTTAARSLEYSMTTERREASSEALAAALLPSMIRTVLILSREASIIVVLSLELSMTSPRDRVAVSFGPLPHLPQLVFLARTIPSPLVSTIVIKLSDIMRLSGQEFTGLFTMQAYLLPLTSQAA